MNRKQFFAAAAIAVLGTSAFAQEATPDTWRDVQLSKSRAEVQAELAQARQDGTIKAWSAGYIEPLKGSLKSRAEVRAEVELARHSGELQAINGEVYQFTPGGSHVRLAHNAR